MGLRFVSPTAEAMGHPASPACPPVHLHIDWFRALADKGAHRIPGGTEGLTTCFQPAGPVKLA